jgi:group I intron endonuclease
MYGFIYLTTNKINGKKYIGMCKNTHGKTYIGSGKLLKEAIKKYRIENFERTILQECETFEELSNAEKFWIEKYNAVEDKNFYNLTPGGFGGNSDYVKEYWSKFSKEERKICRNWSKRDVSGEKNPMFGRKHSEETKRKIGSKSVNRNWISKDHNGSNNPGAKKVIVELNGKKLFFNCLKEFSEQFDKLSYSSLKRMTQKELYHKKYNLKIKYV